MLGAAPLCGTCTHLMPCLNAISSIVMWRLVFAPGVPYEILSGFDFANARNSFQVFHGASLRTTTPNV